MKLREEIIKIEKAIEDLKTLESDYKGKKKGLGYQHKFVYLSNKIKYTTKKIENSWKGSVNLWEIWVQNNENVYIPYEVYYPDLFTVEDILFISKHIEKRDVASITKKETIVFGRLIPFS